MKTSPKVTFIINIIVGITVLASGLATVAFMMISMNYLLSNDDIHPTLVSVSGFNLTSDNHFTSFFKIVVNVNNSDHKTTLDFSSIRVLVFKDEQVLAEDNVLSNFSLGKMNVTLIRAEPIGLNVLLAEKPGFNLGLESGMGYIDFDVAMTVSVNSRGRQVYCEHATVNITIN